MGGQSSGFSSARKRLAALLSGVSAAALFLTAMPSARGGTTITSGTATGAFTFTGTTDFIVIDTHTFASFTNSGTIGPSGDITQPAFELIGGTITGLVSNAATISDSRTAIRIKSATTNTIGLGLNNNELGLIRVTAATPTFTTTMMVGTPTPVTVTSTFPDPIFGIKYTGAAVDTRVANSGTILVSSHGNAPGGGSANGISIVSSGKLDADILNGRGGLLSVLASYTGVGTKTAVANGISVSNTTAGSIATIDIENGVDGSGTINVTALAKSIGAGGDRVANASAFGITGIARATASGTASVNIENGGTGTGDIGVININATAEVGGTASEQAHAFAAGIKESALGGQNASANLTNNGTINIGASASAHDVLINDASTAIANATVDYGLKQRATGTGTSASATFNNNSLLSFNLNVTATATAINLASANALVTGNAIFQSATGASNASVLISNPGAININLMATATTLSGTTGTPTAQGAFARASITNDAIQQNASGKVSANATLDNTGTILIDIDANALGSGTTGIAGAAATAAIGGDVIDQDVTAGTTATAAITNAGTISAQLSALANVQPNGLGATARAFISSFIDQDASTTAGGGAANANLTNSGNLTLGLNASALGVTTANATASANRIVSQEAFADNASVSFDNQTGGSLSATLNALANATGATGDANAIASISKTAIAQQAGSSLAPGTSASASINNDGSILIDLGASANGDQGASAIAGEFGDLVLQEAFGTANATVDFANAGTFSALFAATAVAGGGATVTAAFASVAILSDVFDQNATAKTSLGDPSGVASASLTNTGTILIDLGASAAGATAATANARIGGNVVKQEADGTAASVSFSNASAASFSVLLDATASANSGGGNANASIGGFVFDQGAIGSTTTPGQAGAASVSLTNSGTVLVDLNANAQGTGTGLTGGAAATAEIGEGLINQVAFGELSASAAIVNSGTFSALLSANAGAAATPGTGTASGDAVALAGINDTPSGAVIIQSATATTGAGTASGPAGVSLTNSGNFNISLVANASATNAAQATAVIGTTAAPGDVVRQVAQGTAVGTATAAGVSFNNGGTFSLVLDANAVTGATALATPDGNATALAQIFGDVFDQNATATPTASGAGGTAAVSFTNSGSILIGMGFTAAATGSFFGAFASGASNATARASIDGKIVNQNALGQTARVDLTNSGDFSVLLNATATNGVSGTSLAAAFADAIIGGTVFNQTALATVGAGGAASASFINTGSILIALDANAAGMSSAAANAIITGNVVDQVAVGQTASVFFSNTSPLSFSVVLDATALAATGAASAKAKISADVFDQTVTATPTSGGAGGTASAAFTNSGSVLVDLHALASGTTNVAATAKISGSSVVDQVAQGQSAAVSLTNSGDFSVLLAATANHFNAATPVIGTFESASASAGIGENAFNQSARGTFNDGGVASASFSNTGSILLDIQASANASAAANAEAELGGRVVTQFATGTNASVAISNGSAATFSVLIDATATATNGSGDAAADILGYVFNQQANAFTRTTGLSATVVGGTALASLTNSGSVLINLNANALGTGTSGASATAEIKGGLVRQQAIGEVSASVSFDNQTGAGFSATLSANAGSSAATGAAFAKAGFLLNSSGAVISQSALATTGTITLVGAGPATVSLTNSGNFNIALIAGATATAFATASAVIGSSLTSNAVVRQFAKGTQANVTFSNASAASFSLVLDANADTGAPATPTGDANARAQIFGDVFEQNATATPTIGGSGGTAAVSFTNSGSILVDLDAFASGVDIANATASITGNVLEQDAFGRNAVVALTNSGDFTVSLDATARWFTGATTASALASIGSTVFDQNAFASIGGGGAATASFINTGDINISLGADAFGFNLANADAVIKGDVVNQQAKGSSAGAVALFSNTSTMSFSVVLDATATGASSAIALASIKNSVVDQSAKATSAGALAGPASASLTNSGSFLVDLGALATGQTNATATAKVGGNLVNQFARGTSASVSFANSNTATGTAPPTGFFTAVLAATASAPVGSAKANAFIGKTVFDQNARATSLGLGTGPASASLTNNGSILIGMGFVTTGQTFGAVANGSSFADADAFIGGNVVDQVAKGTAASVSLSNAGSFRVFLDATAIAASGEANALASINADVFDQTANAASGAASAAYANSGSVLVDLHAFASGTTDVDATAKISDSSVVDQSAQGQTATVSLTNSGDFSVILAATANHTLGGFAGTFESARALASIGNTAFHQDARATSVGAGVGPASASFTNSGTILVDLNANATGLTAVARARIGTPFTGGFAAIGQVATGTSATVSLMNSGSIKFDLDAVAIGGAPATATAAIFGTAIAQSAVGTNFASVAYANTITATTSFNLAATASDPALANATAQITGDVVHQFASATAGNAVVAYTNNGSLNANLTANATANTGIANALASVGGTLFDQDAVGTGTASASLINNGTLAFNLKAIAGGSSATSANATAQIGFGVFNQSAIADNPSLTLTLGQFSLDIDATAAAPAGAAVANASIATKLVNQHAVGATTGFAGISFTNTGLFGVSLSANAVGSASANAFAGGFTIAGVHQFASAGDALVDFDNNGTFVVNITANALANGTGTTDNATALASFGGDGILQTAIAAAGGAEQFAGVAVFNTGTLAFNLDANATGDTARATARFGTTAGTTAGIHQHAFGGKDGSAVINNSGLILFSLSADASGGQPATALASFAGTGIAQFAGGSTDADVIMTNTASATTAFSVIASAFDPASARATARMTDNGVAQTASAPSAANGNANARLTNNGLFSVNILANATATLVEVGGGPATAVAALSGSGIRQKATGGTGAEAFAGAAITNAGTIAFNISADANGGTANASARLGTTTFGGYAAIRQNASSGDRATATLSNSGLISVNISADANGGLPATALAVLAGTGVAQAVLVSGASASLASAALTNSGTMTFGVSANAVDPALANATASITGGVVDQAALALGATITARAGLTNSGTFSANVAASANASTGTANALARIGSTAIDQNATAVAGITGAATASFVNGGLFTLGVNATAFGNATIAATGARASALFGADVVNQFALGDVANAAFANSGTFMVSASVSANAGSGVGGAAGLASIAGDGIEQDVTGTVSANATLTNSGTIFFDLVADADSIGPVATARVGGALVDQFAAASVATVSLANAGIFAYSASAKADANTGSASAVATIGGDGIRQSAIGTGGGLITGSALLTNTGSLTFVQRADASGSTANATAVAGIGDDFVQQFARGQSALASISNTSLFGYSAIAKADANGGIANAFVTIGATAIEQDAIATLGGPGAANALITNTGSILVLLNADASGSTANAVARIGTAAGGYAGIDQFAIGSSAIASLNNQGSIIFDLDASAIGGLPATAAAVLAGTGILQSAIGIGTAPVVLAAMTNTASAVTSFNLSAFASDAALANANASITGGVVRQNAVAPGIGAAMASAFLTNNGSLSATLNATARAGTGAAGAVASIGGTAIQQDAIAGAATGPAPVAMVNLTNNNSISLSVNASATGAAPSASALFGADVLNQFAIASGATVFTGVAVAGFANNGTFAALAEAKASGDFGAAALASIAGDGIEQDAIGFGGLGSGSALLTNTGTLRLALSADADADTNAGATARIGGDAVNQLGLGGTALASLVNSNTATGTAPPTGFFTVALSADAKASAGTAAALASIAGDGIEQDAFGGGVNTASLTNSGTLLLSLVADASVKFAGVANATALIGGDAVNQAAIGALANASLSNAAGATLAVMLDASANAGSGGPAVALARIAGTGIEQDANGGASGTALLANSGSLFIALDADASVATGGPATASALIGGDAINQLATGTAALASLANASGAVLWVSLDANAVGSAAIARASIAGDGIEQSAIGGIGGSGTASLTNSGTIRFDLRASAFGTAPATASAIIGGDVVNQFAIGTPAAATFTNSNLFLVNLTATAVENTGFARASASIAGSGIEQSAIATGLFGDANALLTNSGTLQFVLNADASGDVASATARLGGDVVNQFASHTFGATASITNAATFIYSANAAADAGSGNANALAIMNGGIEQRAMGIIAAALVTNTGTFAIMQGATASATSGAASAAARVDADVVKQVATGVFGAARLTNTATFLYMASAKADALLGTANALAQIDGTVIQQTAIGAGAVAGIDNTGSLIFSQLADADATTGNATAAARVGGDVIHQFGDGSTIAAATIINGGTIAYMAGASANAISGSAIATASIGGTGIQQSAPATAVNSAGLAQIANSGSIVFDLEADANADSQATANALVSGDLVNQRATGASSATASISNATSAFFSALLDASAVGSAAFARASIGGTGIEQDASGVASGIASLTNSGTIRFDLRAFASGSAPATALAQIGGDVVNQFASGTSAAASFTNGSLFVVNLDATAIEPGGLASAQALIGDSGFDIDASAVLGTGGAANATFANSGTVTFAINASANGGANVTNPANATAGFSGDVVNVDAVNSINGTANSTFTNSGVLMVDINATAIATAATSGFAFALATVHDIVEQEALAGGGSSAAAAAAFANTGLIAVGVAANASGTSSALAQARIDSDIVDQKASAVIAATASFTNASGATLAAMVTARAISTSGGKSALGSGLARAFATLESAVIEQTAIANSATGVAAATATNNGTLVVAVNATAIGATATASANQGSHGDVVFQRASAGSASTDFTNDGTFSLVLDAFASGITGPADARATFSESGFELQATGAGGVGSTGSASFTNTGTLTLAALAQAVASGSATATAFFKNDVFDFNAFGETAAASFDNSGNLTVLLSAKATSTGTDARAFATFGETGIEMDATANQGGFISASVSLVNSGTLSMLAMASASGVDTVTAKAKMSNEFVDQTAFASATASVSFVNSGTMTLGGAANAVGFSASALAIQTDDVIEQNAFATGGTGAQASVSFSNSGTFTYGLSANAIATSGANASAVLTDNVVEQLGLGETVNLTFTNSGNFAVGITALASASTGSAEALAVLFGAVVSQVASAFGGTANNGNLLITNSGNLTGSVNATALAPSDVAVATAILGAGFAQFVSGATINHASIVNSGTASFNANALAVGTSAFALAIDPGAVQGLFTKEGTETKCQQICINVAGDNVLSFTNSGSFSVAANATADAGGGASAIATAIATGVRQGMFGGPSATGTMAFDNSGSFSVSARATANGAAFVSVANAFAVGYSAKAQSPDQIMTLDVVNSGTFNVNATALVGGGAATFAGAGAKATGMLFQAAVVAGSALNSGTLSVNALASGGTTNDADAFGVVIAADVFSGTFTNTGSLIVVAQGSTTATGIFVTTSAVQTNTIVPGAETGTIVNDGGTLFVATQNGSLARGNAINVEGAPNPILISLQGNVQQGNIFGHIDLGTDDSIEVTNGPTRFDGIVNPDGVLEGDMSVKSGGTLTLASNTTQGDFSVVNVDTYTQSSDGTIVYELPLVSQTPGQINANVVNLDGTVSAILAPTMLLPNSLLYEEVVVANTLNGVWATTESNLNTPFGELMAIYPGDNTADLAFKRIKFNEIPGLTINQNSAATGIENVYDPNLTGPFADLLFDIQFNLPIEDYPNALDQLAGAEFAQNLQMNLWSMGLLNDAVQDRVNAGAVASSNRYNQTLIQRGDTAIWASATRTWGDNDGDVEAPGYDRNQNAFYAGIDHAFANHFLLGFVAGYYENEVDFVNGNRKDEDGVQLGLYAAYDDQRFYARGLFGYAMYNADSRRMIDIVSTVGTTIGEYDVRVFSVGGEVGRRFEVGTNAYVTPFGALRYANARNDEFTETGVPAANLTVFESTGKSLLSELGLRFSAAINHGANTLIVPEISASWQRELLDEIVTTNHAFAIIPGSDFPIISSHTDPDALLIRAGLSIAHGESFEVKVGYTGQFRGDFTEHGASIRFTFKFGKSKSAAPRPEPVTTEPAPVVQPAPPPEPVYEEPAVTIPGPFLVFFDWDSSALDEEDYRVIDEAVAAFNEFGIARIFAEGHTDRAGAEDYNQGLSEQRAGSVRRALIERGVPDTAINFEGKGEREPRVATEDGMREAQNRRVEITLIE